MFERYTEHARRAIFFGRYEASRFGSDSIEPEHLLLALYRDGAALMNRCAPGSQGAARAQIEREKPPRPKVSTNADLPLSHPAKQVLFYGAEEAELLNHSHIGVEHLLLGLLREKGLASRILENLGLSLDIARERIVTSDVVSTPKPLTPEEAASEREMLLSLIAALPDDALRRARQMVEESRVKTSPPSEGIARMRQQMLERTGQAGFVGGRSGWLQEGQFSSSSMENGIMIFETRRIHKGHQIRLNERIRFSDDGKTLHYSQELHGPKGEHSWSKDFDIT